jgi:hypothetical protein
MSTRKSTQDYEVLIEGLELAVEGSILRLLASRGPGATVTLSEAALAVGGDGWRALLDLTYMVARRLAVAGVVEFVEGGRAVDAASVSGSTALRLSGAKAARMLGRSRLN